MRFDKKTVLVTGGNSGIGFATAKRLVSEGAQVIITGRDEKKLNQAVQELGNKAFGVVADASKPAELEKLYKTISQKYGNLDGIFANAGIAINEPIDQVTEDSFDKLINTNLKGVFFTVQKALPYLNKGASIVLNSSVTANRGLPNMTVYASTKAAVRSLARGFSAELLGRGIRVNVVSPGPINTPIWNRDAVHLPQEHANAIAQSIPMKRFGEPEEIASAAAFLLSHESSYIAGEDIHVDGGGNQI